jgi:hypothetical protein
VPAGSHSPRLSAQTRGRVRRVLLGSIALLYIASVPWYRDPDAPLRIVFGLPDWVAVAIACYAVAACLNAAAWLLSDTAADPEEGALASGAPGPPLGKSPR